MKMLFCLLLLTSTAFASTSRIIPAFLEAVDVYRTPAETNLFLKPEVRAVLKVLHDKKIPAQILVNFQNIKKTEWPLPADDQFDGWIKEAGHTPDYSDVPQISLQASKIDVINSSQMSDDIYAYFFITDGVIPTGKVTSIYKGISSGQSFFLNQIDRSIFPLVGIPVKTPSNHLIVDYGIIESDGDDIKKLQQLSSIIIDIAITVYSTQNPEAGQVLSSLRKEIKALADLLISQNNDDRLVTDSFGYTTEEISGLMSGRSFYDFKKNHKKTGNFSNWEYDVSFRILR